MTIRHFMKLLEQKMPNSCQFSYLTENAPEQCSSATTGIQRFIKISSSRSSDKKVFLILNRMGFLLECLEELDGRFQKFGSKLHIFLGKPIEVFKKLHQRHRIAKLCFDQDPEPIWKARDDSVKMWCKDEGIDCVEKVGHTLWNPQEVVDLNGGKPPVTFSMFNHVVSVLGLPPR